MTKYEIKKILSKLSNKIAVLLIFAVLAVSCFLAIGSVNFVDEDGNSHSGIGAARQLKEVKNEWAGDVTADKLREVIEENRRINDSSKYLSNDIQENNQAYAEKQGFMDLRELINRAFSDFREYDYYRADSVSADEAGMLYESRITMLKTWLDTDALDQFSEKEKQFLLAKYEELETPLYYEYADGFQALIEYSPTLIMLLVLITSFLVSGIFSSEFQLNADAIFFSAKHGRNKAIKSKIYAGFWIVTALYWGFMLLYTVIVLSALGAGGANCMIQIWMGGFKSLYAITFLQAYLLVLAGGYLGSLFILTLTMLVSAKTHSTVFAVTTPFILLFIPSFLSGISVMSKILGVLPDQLLQMNMVIKYFNLYQIGNRVLGAVPILMAGYFILYLAMNPLLYRIYKRTEIK